jgi:hypothetical protein
LAPDDISRLVARYATNFHPYFPLVPREYFDPSELDNFAETQEHLFTAVLTVSSKDLPNMSEVHRACSELMVELISDITRGASCNAEAVVALLIVAEWEPQGLQSPTEEIGSGEEDRAAWMHVGIALRAGYYLGLDRTSFRDPVSEKEDSTRKRLIWTCCYISDRLISVRIGRAFWSRGPGPTINLKPDDFPSLKPLTPEDNDYAKILQATLELTQLYGNVHDVLYSGMRTNHHMMLTGDYVKYIDDFRRALELWDNQWKSFNCKCNLAASAACGLVHWC